MVTHERGEIQLEAGTQDTIKGKMEPEQIALESLVVGTGVEAPEQPHLSYRKMQRTTVRGCRYDGESLEQGEITSLQVAVEVKPDKLDNSLHCKIVILQIGWQQGKVEVDNVQNE